MKDNFERIAKAYIKRDGIDTVLQMLSTTDFYKAPASTKYHDSCESGLVEHSIRVAKILFDDLKGNSQFSDESKAIVSLFHDICKIGYYTVDTRNVKENGVWKQVPYYAVDDKLPLGHGEKSVIMLMQLMRLSTEEMMAIRWHMGAYSGQQDWNTLGTAFTEFPLALHLHLADMKATYLPKEV